MSKRLAYLAGSPPDRQPTSSSDLRSKLATGLEAVTGQIPPQYRAMASLILPRLRTYLQSASETDLRRSLEQIRDVIDGMLYTDGPPRTGTAPD